VTISTLRLTPHRRSILEALLERPVQTREIAERLYADDESGGPDSAHKVIHVLVHRLRAAGVPIVTGARGEDRGRYGIAEEAREDVRRLLAGANNHNEEATS